MGKMWCVVILVMVMVLPSWSAAQMTVEPAGAAEATNYLEQPAPDAGASLLAAVCNLAYFPVRFAITLVTAELGGFTGWMTGGNEAAAHAVWQSTEGPAYMQPEVLEGRERLRFGRWH